MYKVVHKNSAGGYESAFIYNEPLLRIDYLVNEFVHADPEFYAIGYGLMVFDTLEEAYDFIETWKSECEIWTCEVGEIKCTQNLPFLYKVKTRQQVLQRNLRPFTIIPDHTVVTNKVKLLKKIESNG